MKKDIEQLEMERIVLEHSNSISLHDKYGNILMNFMGVKVSNLVGLNSKELANEYDWSPSQRAIHTKSMVTGASFPPKRRQADGLLQPDSE